MTNGAFEEWVIWTRFPSPELVRALRGLQFARIVYEVVDNYAAEPLYTRKERHRLEGADAELSSRAIVITASSGAAGRLKDAALGTHWLPIGQDSRLQARPMSLSPMRRPRLVLAGSMDELADESCLYDVAAQRPTWELVLVGVRDPGWGTRLSRLPNVHWFGRRTPEETRGIIADCDVALNPCVLNEWTTNALPVKVFDYLAEGKPIVSTPMNELKRFSDLISLAPADQFVAAIERALTEERPEMAIRRREVAARFTQQERARRAYELITAPTPPSAVGGGTIAVEALSRRQA